jgi:transcriptional regulator with XRE-family HTH domain
MSIGFKISVVPDGVALRRAREVKGWSQDALVASGNRTFAIETVRRAEGGKRVSREKLEKICETLGIDVESILSQKRLSELLEMFILEIPQALFARYLARTLGLEDKFESFIFFEETGDLDPSQSRLILKGGMRVKFRFDDIEGAQARLIGDLAQPLSARGMHPSCWVVEGFKSRWGKSRDEIPSEAQIICVLEASSLNLDGVDGDDLANELIRYVCDIPEDADRSFLNAIPEPSETKKMLTELVRREAWPELHMALSNVASIRSGIAVLWGCEIVKLEASIKNAKVKTLMRKAKPKEEGQLRVWGEKFMDSWLSENWE